MKNAVTNVRGFFKSLGIDWRGTIVYNEAGKTWRKALDNDL